MLPKELPRTIRPRLWCIAKRSATASLKETFKKRTRTQWVSMLFQPACSHYAPLPFSCAPWRCFACLFVFHWFSVMAVLSQNYFLWYSFNWKLFYSPPSASGPGGCISVPPVLYQILNSPSIFTLSFINLCASFKLFSSSYSTPSNLLLALLIGTWVSYPITLSRLAKGLSLPHCQSSFLGTPIYMWLLTFLGSPNLNFYLWFSFLFHSTSMVYWNSHKLESVINQCVWHYSPPQFKCTRPLHQLGPFILLALWFLII